MLSARRLIAIIEAAGYNAEPYAGRHAYGRQCVSMAHDTRSLAMISDLIKECDNVEEASALVYRGFAESLGLRTLIYWPDMAWPEDRDEEGDAHGKA